MAKIFTGLYILLLLLLLAVAINIWHLHCEGFGCMGIGIAWLVWVMAFFAVLGMGLLAWNKAIPGSFYENLCKVTWWFQVAFGAILSAVWIIKNTA